MNLPIAFDGRVDETDSGGTTPKLRDRHIECIAPVEGLNIDPVHASKENIASRRHGLRKLGVIGRTAQ